MNESKTNGMKSNTEIAVISDIKIHNDIIRCEKGKSLTLSASRIYTHIINKMREGDSSIYVDRTIAKKHGIPLAHYKKLMEEIKEEFFDFRIKIDTDATEIETNLISASEKMKDGTGAYIFSVSDKLKPYMNDPKKDFTHLPMEFVSLLNKSHAITMYLLLSSYLYRKKNSVEKFNLKVDIPSLKKALGIPLDHASYKDNSNFRKRIIKPCCDDITEKTDVHVDYKFTKTGRSYTHIVFFLTRKSASPALPMSGTLVRIPDNIKGLLNDWDYKLVGKALSFIETYIESYGASLVYEAMKEIDKWSDPTFRAKMVKSLLPIYCEDVKTKRDRYEENLAGLADKQNKEAIAALKTDQAGNEDANAWMLFKVSEPESYDKLMTFVQEKEEFKFLRGKDDLLDKVAMSHWRESSK